MAHNVRNLRLLFFYQQVTDDKKNNSANLLLGAVFKMRYFMKAKVLFCYYSDHSGYQVVRIYLEKDFEQAKKDFDLMATFASDCRTWKLEDVEVFGS